MKTKFQRMLENLGMECRSYSGRGMCGKECLGVYPENTVGGFFGNLLSGLADMNDPEFMQELAEIFIGMRTDTMGKGEILYFPKVEFSAE